MQLQVPDLGHVLRITKLCRLNVWMYFTLQSVLSFIKLDLEVDCGPDGNFGYSRCSRCLSYVILEAVKYVVIVTQFEGVN